MSASPGQPPVAGPRTSPTVRPLQTVSVHANRLARAILALGWRHGPWLYLLDVLPGSRRRRTRWQGIPSPVLLRLGRDHSDLRTALQVVHDAEYEVELAGPVETVVDAGANVGLAAVWFANRYPGARIVAVEPDAENLEVLRANVAAYPQVQVLQAGLWSEDTVLEVFDPGGGSWSMQVRGVDDDAVGAPGPGAVEAVSMPTLLSRAGMERVNLLKVDIEGAELELFDDASAWIDRVDAVAVELHDRLRPGCSRRFFDATSDFAVSLQRGENTFVLRAAP